MKRLTYILAFSFLGFLLATLIHAIVELIALQLIFGNPLNAETVWWQNWQQIHAVVGTILWIVGLVAGLLAGIYWWDEYGKKPGAFVWGKQK